MALLWRQRSATTGTSSPLVGQMPWRPVRGSPIEVLNDEGIGHTAGTPVAGNVTLYWGVIWGVIDQQINGVFRLGGVSMQRGIQVSSQFEKGTSEFPGREFLEIRRYLLYRRPLSSPFHGGILANPPGMLEKSWADSLKH